MPDNKKPKGTSQSDKKNVVSYTSPKFGSTIQVDTSGFSSGAKKFNATAKYPSGTISNKTEQGITKDFITNKKGAERIIKLQQGKSSVGSIPVKGKSFSRPDTPLASTPQPKKIV